MATSTSPKLYNIPPTHPALPPGNSHADATPLVREYAAQHALRLDE